MNYTEIEIQVLLDGKLKIAYLNRPESYNALNKKMLTELREFVKNSNDDENLRCIAISGRGNAFCAGQNLKEALTFGKEGNSEFPVKSMVEDFYNPLVIEISNCRKPIISLVNGAAVGAGAMLALICDFTLATANSYFSQAFSNIGLIPDTGGTYFLPKLLGKQQANYLAFTGKKLSAMEAVGLGLIADVFEDENFENKSLEIMTQIANMPTTALYLTKKAFNSSYNNTLENQLQIEADMQQEAAETKDFMEGVTAFLEKRKPNYKGS